MKNPLFGWENPEIFTLFWASKTQNLSQNSEKSPENPEFEVRYQKNHQNALKNPENWSDLSGDYRTH